MAAREPLVFTPRAVPLYGGAGIALLVAQALLPTLPSDAAGQVSVAAAHRGAEIASTAAFLAAGILLVLAAAASSSLGLTRGRALTRVGLVMTGIGALWPVAGRAAFNAVLVAITESAVPRSAAVATAHAVADSAAFALFLPLLVCFALGPVLLALGLRRARVLPVYPALLWLGGVIVVDAAEGGSRLAASAGMLLVAAALAWIGSAVAKTGYPSPTS